MRRLNALFVAGVIAVTLLAGLCGCSSAASYPPSGSGGSGAPASQPIEQVVYITRTGAKFHRAGCRYLSRSETAISRSEAVAEGYAPCSVCNP